MKSPKGLFGFLDFEELGFLSFLMEYQHRKTCMESLEQEKGGFFCSYKTILNMCPAVSFRTVIRLFDQLKKHGILHTWMKYGSKNATEANPYGRMNHRMIRIYYKRILEKVEKTCPMTHYTE